MASVSNRGQKNPTRGAGVFLGWGRVTGVTRMRWHRLRQYCFPFDGTAVDLLCAPVWFKTRYMWFETDLCNQCQACECCKSLSRRYWLTVKSKSLLITKVVGFFFECAKTDWKILRENGKFSISYCSVAAIICKHRSCAFSFEQQSCWFHWG